MDSSHTVLVHLKLNSENFESFQCKNKIIIGINMINLFKLIKTMGNSDTLTLYLEEENQSLLGIKIENSEKNSITDYKLNLMDLNETNIQIPPAAFESIEIYLKNDYPLIIKYTVASLGHIKLCLAPKYEDN